MNDKLLQALRCPKTGGPLQHRAATESHGEGLYSPEAQLFFPIRDGIPILLIEQAIEMPA